MDADQCCCQEGAGVRAVHRIADVDKLLGEAVEGALTVLRSVEFVEDFVYKTKNSCSTVVGAGEVDLGAEDTFAAETEEGQREAGDKAGKVMNRTLVVAVAVAVVADHKVSYWQMKTGTTIPKTRTYSHTGPMVVVVVAGVVQMLEGQEPEAVCHTKVAMGVVVAEGTVSVVAKAETVVQAVVTKARVNS